MYFELLLEDSAKDLCYVNIYPNSIFPCSLLFWLFPLPPFLSRHLASQTAALRTASGSNAWLFWEGKYLAIFRVFLTSWIESGMPTTKELALVREAGNRLKLCLCFKSLAFFRADAHSSLLLSTNQSLCELRLLTGDVLGATHYLSDYRKHFIARGGESPGRLVEPGAKRHNKE